MNFRKWLCTLLALAMLFAMVPAALMEGVTSDNVDEQPEEYDTELGAPEEGEEASIVMNAFELTGPEEPEVPEEPAEPKADEVVAKGFPVYDGVITTTSGFTVDHGVITGYIGSNDVVIESPLSDGVNGTTVVGIANSAFAGKGITSITIPATVSEIEDGAFSGCSDLTTVKFLEGSWLTYLGYGTFEDCAKLTSITLPKAISAIPDYCFQGCLALTNDDVANLLSNVDNIGSYAFSGCTGLSEITIPENVESVGYKPFSGCTNLQITVNSGEDIGYSSGNLTDGATGATATLSSTAKTLPGGFYTGTGVKSIGADILTPNIEKIGTGAFKNFSELESVSIPDNVKNIAYGAFEGCTSLKSIKIPASVTTIGFILYPGNGPFVGCTSLDTIYVEPGEKATYSVEALTGGTGTTTKVELTGTVKVIPGGFYANQHMEEITIPDSVVSIGIGAYKNCKEAKSVKLPEGLEAIGENAFFDCEGLTEITLPEGLEKIGYAAFHNTNIKEIAIPSTVSYVEYNAFDDCVYLETITVTTGTLEDYEGGNGPTYDKLTYGNHAKVVLADGSKSIPGRFYDRCTLSEITIPATVTAIGEYAFYKCSELTAIVLPEGVTEIGNRAFQDCEKLTTINLDNVTKIGERAFENCTALTELTLTNKDTAIAKNAIPKTITIKCYAGSKAEEYAKKNGNPIKYLDPVNHMVIGFKDGDTYPHTGSPIEPELTVTFDDKVLVKDTDFSVTYANNTEPGTATAIVVGKGEYASVGEEVKKELPFTITSQVGTLTASFVKPESGSDGFYYTGSAIEPEVAVKAGETALVKGTDYSVAYANNVNEGTATATITVTKAGFAGTIELPFTIIRKVVVLDVKSKKVTENKGVKFQIKLPEEPTVTITKCKSSKPKVASVTNDGFVTPLAAGKTNITVTMSNKKTRKIVLTVEDPTQVTKAAFTQAGPLTLKVGETLALTYTLEPAATCDKGVTFKVNSTKTATVDANGVVTGVKKGTVTVTLTPNNPAKKNVKAKIKIKVVP